MFGDQYFGHYRIREEESNAHNGPFYDGPVVVLVDAETYSVGDTFAAVVQDSGAAMLVGVDGSTGGGGSVVYSSEFLLRLYPGEFTNILRNFSSQQSVFRIRAEGRTRACQLSSSV